MARHLMPLLLAVTIVGASPAHAAAPTLGSIMPRGAQRGTTVTLQFQGARLGDAKEVMVYYPGVTVTGLKVVNDGLVNVTARIAPDCRLGEHAVRLRTASGISEFHTFYVGALPVIDEKEPNSEFTTPQKIPLNVTVSGVVDSEDVDYFAFQAKKGQRVTAEIEAMRLGEALFDPYVAILDGKRFELAASDDAPLLGQDAVASAIIPADGTYYVQVRETSYGGNGSCRYRLHVGTFPRPTAVVPAGGRPGEEVEVTFLGDVAGPFRQKVKLPLKSDTEKFGLFAQDAGGIAPSPVPFRLSDLPNAVGSGANITPDTATPLPSLPAAANGYIAQPGTTDYYRFKAKKGQVFDVHCYARRLGSALDPVMTVAYFKGGTIAANDDAIGPDSYFRWAAPEDKEYVLTVTDHLGKGGPSYFYRVEFTPVQPKLALTIPKVDIFGYSQERQAIVVPRGNRYATMMATNRTDFGGDLLLSAAGLPKGVTMHAEKVPADLAAVPVVFEAAPDAPVAGALAHLGGKHADPAQKIQGGFEQSVILVAVPNQGIYWKHDVDRAAVAVAEEVPFKVALVEPKVPLVQNGSMNLKIVAERKKGFKAPITVYPLFNPPGVGSASAATIGEGQTETVLPINAAGNAPARKWKTAVIATATVGNGPVWVSSQLTNLEVAVPYLTFAMERAAAEQGKAADLFCKVQQVTPFPGKAHVKLLGLPPKVAAPDIEITKDTKEFAFKLTLDKAAPAGQHKNIFCQVVVTQNGEPIVHNLGGTELRIDVPLPPKANEPKAVVAAKPAAPAAAPPMEKRLSRLEKLRLEQEEREKAQK